MRVVPETAASHVQAPCSSRLCSSDCQSVSPRAVDSALRSRTRHLRAHPELKSAAGETTGGACLGKDAAMQRPSVRLDAEVAAGSALRCRLCCAICARRCGLCAADCISVQCALSTAGKRTTFSIGPPHLLRRDFTARYVVKHAVSCSKCGAMRLLMHSSTTADGPSSKVLRSCGLRCPLVCGRMQNPLSALGVRLETVL